MSCQEDVVSMQIVRDSCCLIKKDRHMNLSKLSKTFAVYLILKENMVQIYEQVVSDIESKDTLAIFCTGCKILMTLHLQL